MPFEINCQHVLLTYPKKDLSKDEIYFKIKNYFGSYISILVIGEESYKLANDDRSRIGCDAWKYHFHVFIEFTSKRKVSGKVFDSFNAGVHGHYKPVRSTIYKAMAYCAKDGNYRSYIKSSPIYNEQWLEWTIKKHNEDATNGLTEEEKQKVKMNRYVKKDSTFNY